MHQIAEIVFQKCIFSFSEEEYPPFYFVVIFLYIVLTKPSKHEGGGIDLIIANTLLEINYIGFSVKC